jgi:hypothetical protein
LNIFLSLALFNSMRLYNEGNLGARLMATVDSHHNCGSRTKNFPF